MIQLLLLRLLNAVTAQMVILKHATAGVATIREQQIAFNVTLIAINVLVLDHQIVQKFIVDTTKIRQAVSFNAFLVAISALQMHTQVAHNAAVDIT